MSATHINEYRHVNGIDGAGAVAGSELDGVLSADPDYELVGKGSPAPAALAAAEETTEPDAGETPDIGDDDGDESDGSPDEVDIETLNRDELNSLASGLGIEDAETLPNKGAVKDAIKAAQAAAEEG